MFSLVVGGAAVCTPAVVGAGLHLIRTILQRHRTEMKLHGLVPNFYIHASVSDLFIPMIGPPIFAAAK